MWLLIAVLGGTAALLALNHEAGSLFGVENEDAARIVLGATLVVALTAGMIGRGTLGEAARHALGWALLFLVVIGAYAYRQEAEWVARRLAGELLPGTALVQQSSPDGSPQTVAVVRSIGGHFRVSTEVNDAPVTMLVDTGASVVTLTASDAEDAGIVLADLSFSLPIMTANGRTTAAPIVIDRLAVGPIERRRVPGLVAQPGQLDRSLLGMSFLDTLHGYSVSGDRLVLNP